MRKDIQAAINAVVDARILPLVVTMEDELLHTDEHPFCSDIASCPCHQVIDASTGKITDYFMEHIEGPRLTGLLSYDEAMRIYHNEHI